MHSYVTSWEQMGKNANACFILYGKMCRQVILNRYILLSFLIIWEPWFFRKNKRLWCLCDLSHYTYQWQKVAYAIFWSLKLMPAQHLYFVSPSYFPAIQKSKLLIMTRKITKVALSYEWYTSLLTFVNVITNWPSN